MSQITHHVAISGMTCGGCSGRVTNVLANTPGVIHAEISHESNSGVIVSTDEISIQEIIEIERALEPSLSFAIDFGIQFYQARPGL